MSKFKREYTRSPSGRLIYHVFDVIAQFERDRIRERLREGISSAKLKGRNGSRPSALPYE